MVSIHRLVSSVGQIRTRFPSFLLSVPSTRRNSASIDDFAEVESFEDCLAYLRNNELLRKREESERRLAVDKDSFFIKGFCAACRRKSSFLVDYLYSGPNDRARRRPNWRERAVCVRCGLNSRLRAAIHAFEGILLPDRHSRIYVTEQVTPMYRWLKIHYPNVIGSEYLGVQLHSGEIRNEIRHEDLCSLSLPDSSIDILLSFDVFEHIPDYESAIAECARVTRPGGKVLISVPFICDARDNLVRAKVVGGKVIHLATPEYHGNPVDPNAGALCFYHFGWEFLRTLKLKGFSKACVLLYWSTEFAYLGGTQLLIWGVR